VLAPDSHPVCSECGLIAIGAACAGCQKPLAPAAERSELPAGLGCAVVRASAPCRICGLAMPLNHLPIDGAVRCLHCARSQAPEENLFPELVHSAHAVVDLAGEEQSPYAAIGRTAATAVETFVDEATAVLGPGGPRCELCSGALKVEVPSPGVVTSTCKGCGDRAEYRAKPEREYGPGFVAVLASEHRTDRASVKNAVGGAAIAITCPNCGAPLEPKLERQAVSCTFCNTPCRIPEDTWAVLKGAPRQQPWYLLFQGPSTRREELQEERERRARREEAEENRRAKHRRKAAQRAGTRGPDGEKRGLSQVALATIAGVAIAVAGGAAGAAVFVALKDRVMQDPGFPAVGVAVLVIVIGAAFTGTGPTAGMPRERSRAIIVGCAIVVLFSMAFLLVVTSR
jgi:hypothetical protein